MLNLGNYLKSGLAKKQNPNFAQIKKQIKRAEKDLQTFDLVINKDPEWASTIAYQSMLRGGRALMFAHGFLPTDGQQHKTVVEITGKILGPKFYLIVKQFDRMRKKRNVFLYDSESPNNLTEAKIATKTAQVLLEEIKKKIQLLNPQQPLW